MTKQEQLATLVCASQEFNTLVGLLLGSGILTEDEAKDFDDIIEKIDKVAEAIRHEATPPSIVYIVHEDCDGIIGCHKTFEGAKKQLMESGGEKLAEEYPLDYDGETCWGWDVLYIERTELGE